MSERKDLEDMIEVLHMAIVRQETEREFFKRSAESSTSQASKTLFSEIADDLMSFIKRLENRRLKLEKALDALSSKR